jgi:hypothetical protein
LRGGQPIEMAGHVREVLVDGEIRSHFFQKQHPAPSPRHAYGALNDHCRQVVSSGGRRCQKRLLIEGLRIEDQPVHVEDHGGRHARKLHLLRIFAEQ